VNEKLEKPKYQKQIIEVRIHQKKAREKARKGGRAVGE